MILPIIAYGDPVLRKVGRDIDKDYPNLSQLIADMFETMYHARGVGLAAPQIGLDIRLFIVDASPFDEDEDDKPELKNFKKVFINAYITDESGNEWPFNEGCLSIPEIREDVNRLSNIKIKYVDENFVEHTEDYKGILARIIQHEYDHIEGILFTDHLNVVKKRMIKNKLSDITRGKVSVDYKMKLSR